MERYTNIIIKNGEIMKLLDADNNKILKNNIETAMLKFFIMDINKKPFNAGEEVWAGRFMHFLSAMLGSENMPKSVELEDIVEYLEANKSESLYQYVTNLPGMKYPLRPDGKIEELAIHNHQWMTLMYKCSDELYNDNIESYPYCKLVFKKDNCFKFLINNNYIHIQSNTNNILDFNWTIISTESSDHISIKKINFKKKEQIVCYIKNYEDLKFVEGDEVHQLIEIIMY